MIEVTRYNNGLRKEWDDFILRAKNFHFFFLRDYMEYHSDRFEDCSLMFYEGGKLLAVIPANLSGETLYTHQGLSFGGVVLPINFSTYKLEFVFDALIDFCRGAAIKEVVYKALPYIYHSQACEEDTYFLFVKGASLFRRDCNSVIYLGAPFKISQGKKSGRNQARKAGVEVAESTDFDAFFEMANKNLEAKYLTTAVHTSLEMRSLASSFPENIKLFSAAVGGEMMAGALVFLTRGAVHTQYLASSDAGKKLRAMDLLLLTLIEQYRESHQYFSFGISTEEGGKVLNRGLLKQKEEYGAQAVCHDFYRLKVE